MDITEINEIIDVKCLPQCLHSKCSITVTKKENENISKLIIFKVIAMGFLKRYPFKK